MNKSLLIWVGAFLSLFPFISSSTALLSGLFLSLGFGLVVNPQQRKAAKFLLQLSIVLLGFGMDPQAVVRAGSSGVLLTAGSIGFTLLAGWILAKIFGVEQRLATLLSVGTAICGGSAIAAVSPVLNAENEEIAVSLAVVFLLNALALLFFPELGHWLHLSPQSFGYFAAIAIHDTSSVVGAASRYSELSLPIATTIKLTRALWILPLTVVLGIVVARKTPGQFSIKRAIKAGLPWFIPAFLLAVFLRALWTDGMPFFSVMSRGGRAGLNAAIFLIGAQMSRQSLKKAGLRPMLMGVSLWVLVIGLTLIIVKSDYLVIP